MISATIEVKFNNLPKLPPALNRRVEQIVEGAAFACEGLAKTNAPVDTGALRNSIQAKPESPKSWIVAVGVEYALAQEFGTGRIPAHPYMTPATEAVRPQFLGQMQAVVEEVAR